MSFNLVPLSIDGGYSASLNPCSASSSSPPLRHELLPVPAPSDWSTRREGTDHWYYLQEHTTFHIVQYRKCRTSPHHEFLLLFLSEGYVCRVERMGEEDHTEHRRNALRSVGIPTRDCIQVFHPDNVPDFDLDSDVVADINYPSSFDIADVLNICQAIQLNPDSRRYNLWHYNCYFFAWTIITVLARQTAGWDQAFTESAWAETCEQVVSQLSNSSHSGGKGSLAFRFEQMSGHAKDSDRLPIVESVRRNILPLSAHVHRRTQELLWTVEASEIIGDKLQYWIGRAVANETFHCLSPELVEEPAEMDIGSEDTDLQSSEETSYKDVPTLRQTVSSSAYYMTVLFETTLSLAHRRQPNPEIEWLSKLEGYISRASADFRSVCDDEMNNLLDAFPQIPGSQWRHAMRQMTMELCKKQTHRSDSLSRLWEEWVWSSIREVVRRELGDVVSKAEKPNILIKYPKSEHALVFNSTLQAFIRDRIQEHSRTVHMLSRKVTKDVFEKITGTMEEVWQRVALDDNKLGRFNISISLQNANTIHSGILGPRHDHF